MGDTKDDLIRPILMGEDRELGNFMTGVSTMPRVRTGDAASRMILTEIDGAASGGGYASNSQDYGRKWLCDGSCIYIDSQHVETATAEVADGFQLVAASRAALRTVAAALQSANAQLAGSEAAIEVHVNNSDGHSNAWGSHLSYLIPRQWYDDLFERRLDNIGYLASTNASAIVYEGQGKVGSENDAPKVRYQIAQRADFIECMTGEQTMFRRPLVNARDESLCGRRRDLARLHVICKDSTLCQVAALLKAGVTQLNLAFMGLGDGSSVHALMLRNPVEAIRTWSHDPELRRRRRMADGREVTAVEHQLLNFEALSRCFESSDRMKAMVPRGDEVLALYGDTLEKLKARDFDALAPRLDWVLKKEIIGRAIERNPGRLDWSSSDRLKVLDHQYSNLDPEKGLFWSYEKAGAVEQVVSESEIARLTEDPPENTRAWTRGKLLGLARPREIERVDWDSIVFHVERDGFGRVWRSVHVSLDDPAGFTRAELPQLEHCGTLEDALAYLAMAGEDAAPGPPPPPGYRDRGSRDWDTRGGAALDAAMDYNN